MKTTMLFAFALTASAAVAAPKISNVALVQDPETLGVTVSYDLEDDPAVVTLDILQDGASLTEAGKLRHLVGDVSRLLAAGEDKRIFWNAAADWPDQEIKDGSLTAVVTAWPTNMPPDYMAIHLDVTNGVRYYASKAALPIDLADDVWRETRLLMRRIPAANVEWTMGVPTGEKCRDAADTTNAPTHRVRLTKDFYIGVFELSQRQYWRLTGGYSDGGQTPSNCKDSDEIPYRPVENVSYDTLRGTDVDWPTTGHDVGATSVLARMRKLTGIPTLDLPTEAQWEFACRAGTTTGINNGLDCATDGEANDASVNDLAWYGGGGKQYGTSGGMITHRVGEKLANAFGLHDMHGNVYEWCLDRYACGDDFKATLASGWQTGAVTVDPVGAASGVTARVTRGGDYFFRSAYLRAGRRDGTESNSPSQHRGVRLACEAVAK